jgi:hypothetical protein
MRYSLALRLFEKETFIFDHVQSTPPTVPAANLPTVTIHPSTLALKRP